MSRSSSDFKPKFGQPGVFTGFVGGIAWHSSHHRANRAGLGRFEPQQTYSVTMVTKHGTQSNSKSARRLFAVPTNVGPRTMPNYSALLPQGIYTLSNGIRVFAGTVADPFFIDLGAVFDSLNFRRPRRRRLPASIDGDDHNNYAPNTAGRLQREQHRAGSPHHDADGQTDRCMPRAMPRLSSARWATTSRQKV